MAKRSAVEQIVIEERNVSDAILKLVSCKEKASAWHLKWAKFEEDEYLIFLFTKLAEMRWVWNECLRQFSDKHLEYTKTFKEIYHEERVIEDTKKALQTCESNVMKIRKQIETAQKKGDSVKLHSLDKELESQQVMMGFLQRKIDTETNRLFSFKIEQVQKGLKLEAQAGLQLAEQLRHIFIAQRRIADVIGNATNDTSPAAWQMITQSIIGLSDILNIYPPPSGAVDPLPSPSESPYQGKRISHHDSPVHSPSPNTTTTLGTSGRRSFPFPFRPLPHEPVDTEYQQRVSPTGTPNHINKTKFSRTSSDVTPQGINSVTLPYRHKTSITIFEETHNECGPIRSRSASQPNKDMFLSLQRNVSNLNIGRRDNSISPSRSRSHSQYEAVSLSSQEDVSNKSSKTPSDVEYTGGPDFESDYADPIDALRKYYESQNTPPVSDVSSLDAPYQSVVEIQKLRQAQMSKASSYDDDPTYSRPFDCLIGLPTPLKVRAENTTKKIVSPLAIQRQSTPDLPVPLAHRHPTKRRGHHHRFSRKVPPRNDSQSSSDDEDELSSSLSPSPEPDYSPLINNRQSNISFDLIGDDDDPPILLTDEPSKFHVGSEGDLLSMNSVDTQSLSSEPSPVRVPSPVEITSMQNGYAKVVYPDLFISQ